MSGVFPQKRVAAVISGDGAAIAHGTRDMPIWGTIFHQVKRDRDLGRVRIQNVTKCVGFIQKG